MHRGSLLELHEQRQRRSKRKLSANKETEHCFSWSTPLAVEAAPAVASSTALPVQAQPSAPARRAPPAPAPPTIPTPAPRRARSPWSTTDGPSPAGRPE